MKEKSHNPTRDLENKTIKLKLLSLLIFLLIWFHVMFDVFKYEPTYSKQNDGLPVLVLCAEI